MLRSGGLDKDCTFCGVDSAGDVHGGSPQNVLLELLGFLGNRNCVQIDNTKEGIIFILQVDPLFDRTQIISDVKNPTWLDTGKYFFHKCLSGQGFRSPDRVWDESGS